MSTVAAKPAEHPQSLPMNPSPSAARPPVEIHPTAHLDPGAYVRGTHAIYLGPRVLVHPRAQLVSIHGPLIINDGSIIMEKSIIGGPVPDPKDASPSSPDLELDPTKTVIGASVLVLPHAQVHAGAEVRDACVVESHAVVSNGVRIGEHSKVGAGASVDRNVGPWVVVLGDGRQQRKKAPVETVEQVRLTAMERDREATAMVLKLSARAPVLKKK